MKKFYCIVILCVWCELAQAQSSSIATDVSLIRSVTKGSRFWALGQTVQAQYHFGGKTTAYAWLSYYTAGRFKNTLTAVATDSAAAPQRLNYTATSTLRFRQISVGLKHYFKGAASNEASWNVYSITGFGLLLIKAATVYNMPVDTALYVVPQKALAGTHDIVRLTADVGLGAETVLGSGIYVYADVRTWIQASRFPSPYLYSQAVPRVACLSAGIRVLFD